MAVSRRALYQPELRDVKKVKPKQSLKSHTLLVWVSVLLGVVLLLSLISRGKQMRVDKIVVEGNEIVGTNELVALIEPFLDGNYLGLFPRRNSLLLPKGSIKKAVSEKYPRFSSVTVSRLGWRTMRVDLSERKLAYNVCTGEHFTVPCYGMDDTGYVFASAPEFTGSVFFAFRDLRQESADKAPIGSILLESSEISRIGEFAQSVPKLFASYDIDFIPIGVYITSDGSYEMAARVGESETKLLFREGDPGALLHNLSVAISAPAFLDGMKDATRPLLYIDLRFGNKVYFKFTE